MGRLEHALQMDRDVYYGHLKLNGKEDENTLVTANNYASSLTDLRHFEEARPLLRKTMPVARRVLGENHEITISLTKTYARVLSDAPGATIHERVEAVRTLDEADRTARRVLGASHPLAVRIGRDLKKSRVAHKAWYSSKALVVLFAVAIIAWARRYLTNK